MFFKDFCPKSLQLVCSQNVLAVYYFFFILYSLDNQLECFVGATDESGQVFLIESGINCQRNLHVIRNGMKLTKASKYYIFTVNL